ncbi:MAG: RIP metalloprotease RseP, partial [Anaerovoracaceae bacterium]
FLAARACDVRVNEFAIGMGPVLFKKQKGETLYAFKAIPIGGSCTMEGEDEDSDDPKAFNNKPAWKKVIILFAGSFMNIVLAVVVMSIIMLYTGTPTTEIEAVSPKSPAAAAGIKAGDKIIAIGGEKIEKWDDVTPAVAEASKSKDFEITVKRNEKELKLNTTYIEEDGRKIIGITPSKKRNPATAFTDGAKASWTMTTSMYSVLSQLFTGEVSTKELSGPVGIVYVVNQGANQGFMYILYLTAIISLNLAIVNMLPLPALDGGRIVFVAIRKITGKKITDEMEGRVHTIGILLLFGLMIFITWNDIVRFIVPLFN